MVHNVFLLPLCVLHLLTTTVACKVGNGVAAALLITRGASPEITNKQTEKPFALATGEALQVFKIWSDGGTKALSKRFPLVKSLARMI